MECTFSPKVNKSNHKLPNDNLKVGERLYQYQNLYKSNIDNIRENNQESYSFKPEISKNTNEILRQREAIMEEIRKKYDSEEIQSQNEVKPRQHIITSQINEIEENPDENDSFMMNNSSPRKKENSIPERKLSSKNSSKKILATSSEAVKKEAPNKIAPKAKNPLNLYNISDNRLLELANQYITTDESLDKFQSRLKEKYKDIGKEKNDFVAIVKQNYNEKMRVNHHLNSVGVNSSSDYNQKSNDLPLPSKKEQKELLKNKMSKNITKALEFYNIIES